MSKQQLLEHLQDIEWDNFEVKTAKSDVPKDVWETVSAFSNTSGGWIVFGVSEKKKKFEVVGVDDLEIPGTSYRDAEPRYTFRIQEQENLWEYYFALFQRLKLYANNPLTIGEMDNIETK